MGFKLTPQRMAILEFLEGNLDHPSAEDIYRAVKHKFPTMSFATVYNTMEMLKQRGEVVELNIDPNRKRYDPNVMEHHHMICTGCGKIVDVRRSFNIKLPEEDSFDFEIAGSRIEFYGICPSCRKKGGG